MDEDKAERVVEALRSRNVFAHVERSGVYQFGIRVVIPDGREAVWDAEGEAGLEAIILEDGDLVGYVPMIAGSESFGVDEIVNTIAATDYDAPPEPLPGAAEPAHPGAPAQPPGAAEPAHPMPPVPPPVTAAPTRILPPDHPHHRPLSGLLHHLSRRG